MGRTISGLMAHRHGLGKHYFFVFFLNKLYLFLIGQFVVLPEI